MNGIPTTIAPARKPQRPFGDLEVKLFKSSGKLHENAETPINGSNKPSGSMLYAINQQLGYVAAALSGTPMSFLDEKEPRVVEKTEALVFLSRAYNNIKSAEDMETDVSVQVEMYNALAAQLKD